MAWLSSVTSANTIVTNKTEFIQRIVYLTSGYVCKRTATRTETSFVGLTSAAADTQLTASAGTAGCLNAQKQDSGAGSYRVIQEIETYGAWSYDSTLSPVPPP